MIFIYSKFCKIFNINLIEFLSLILYLKLNFNLLVFFLHYFSRLNHFLLINLLIIIFLEINFSFDIIIFPL